MTRLGLKPTTGPSGCLTGPQHLNVYPSPPFITHVCVQHQNSASVRGSRPNNRGAAGCYHFSFRTNYQSPKKLKIKTHLPVQFVPKSVWEQRVKIVYVARNAKDSVVSYYHFGSHEPTPTRTEGLEHAPAWREDVNMVFGSWYKHDCGREIDRLCSFLNLCASAKQKDKIRTDVKFDNMKQNKMANQSAIRTMNHEISPFLRKAKVGDWKNHFTVSQNEQFDEDYKTKMKNLALRFCAEI
ncbi:cytosolic sulfotransferase 1-like [Nothobranchius furzeri]|uniref:cytosolic sulfotransferase 1-like n=1 Tax=Nothobranchius furzeri TaxID=105023 RepID=UPI003904AB4D